MKTPKTPTYEKERIKELESFNILDTIEEEEFDFLTQMASEICQTKIGLVSLIDRKRQWFKSHHGLEARETPRKYAFCAHAINNPNEILLVEDSRIDKRFHDNPLVTGKPYVVFYAGVPLVTEKGYAMGTLCAIDDKPKKLTGNQIKNLVGLANQVVKLLELRKEKVKFQNVISGLNLATWEWNIQSGEASYNERFAKNIGYTLKELEPLSIKTWENLAHPDDYEALWRKLNTFFKSEIDHFEIETRLKHKDGQWVWVFSIGKVINRTNDGKPILIYGANMDITKRKLEEREKEYNSALFKALFELSPIGISLNDLETGVFIDVNDKLLEPTGYRKEEFLKLKFSDITADKHDRNKVNTSKKWMENKLYEPFEKEYIDKNGNSYSVLEKSVLINDIDGNPKVWSFIEDISKKKKAEQELKLVLEASENQNERLKNFAHIVSHNLRSHSGNINMLLKFHLKEIPELKKNQIFNLITNASKNLKETISHLTEVAKVNTNQLEQMTAISLEQACNKAINSVFALAKASSVEIINQIDKKIKIYALPAYLESIILNFLTNAIKYKSNNKKSYVKLYTSKKIEYMILNIEDNGLGIDLEKNGDKIFGMYKTFHRHDDARGIGLFITKNQVEAMGGYIEVESEVNVGTTFKIHFKHIEKVS